MKTAAWFNEHLWHGDFFAPERMQPCTCLFSTSYGRPLLTLLLDGWSQSAHWIQPSGERTQAQALFDAIRLLVHRLDATLAYIINPDDAFSEIRSAAKIEGDRVGEQLLWLFEREPADQGGAAYLCFAFHRAEAIIVLERRRGLSVNCYGDPSVSSEITTTLRERSGSNCKW